jgi:hypothetical protein
MSNKEAIFPALVDIGISGSMGGFGGDWTFELNNPISIRIGRFLVKDVLSGEIGNNGTIAYGRLNTSSIKNCRFSVVVGHPAEMSLESDGYFAELPLCIVAPPSPPSVIVVIPDELVSPDLLPAYATAKFMPLAELMQSDLALVGALKCLAVQDASMLSWVNSVVREVVPIHAPGGLLASSSSPWDCGAVAITADARAAVVAEMLIHEASHQHFFLAKHLGRMDDGSDRTEYYSPMVDSGRQLEKILLAFHALGNMAMLHAAAIRDGAASSDFSKERMREISRRLDKVQPVLHGSVALTGLGRCIYGPLAERLDELRQDRLLS